MAAKVGKQKVQAGPVEPEELKPTDSVGLESATPAELDKPVKSSKDEKVMPFDEKDYMVRQEVERNGRIELVEVYRPNYRTPAGKCKLRAAKRFDVSVDHLNSAYHKLSGKKLDGYYINDLIDRYGFSNPNMMVNRVDLAKRVGIGNPYTVDIAEDKLKLIVREVHVMKAYAKYVGDGMATVRAGIESQAVIGG